MAIRIRQEGYVMPYVKISDVNNVLRTSIPAVSGCVVGHLMGVSIRFTATEKELLKAGIVRRDELPGPNRGAYRELKNAKTARRADGRCNVRVSGIRSAKLDACFQDFMHGLLADTQLSIVKGEKPESY